MMVCSVLSLKVLIGIVLLGRANNRLEMCTVRVFCCQ